MTREQLLVVLLPFLTDSHASSLLKAVTCTSGWRSLALGGVRWRQK
jgi:hypothetical protein